jgi:hypothetical protein
VRTPGRTLSQSVEERHSGLSPARVTRAAADLALVGLANAQEAGQALAGPLTNEAPTSRLLVRALLVAVSTSALGGTRTPNLLIRSQMLYPLSYERMS